MSTVPELPTGNRRWGVGDSVLWLVVAQVASAIWALLIFVLWFDGKVPDPAPVWTLFVGAIPLWCAYGIGPVVTSIRKGDGPVHDFGLTLRPKDVAIGFVLGLVTQLVVLPVLYFPILRLVDADPGEAAEELIDLINGPVDRLLMILLIVFAAPLVEEIFFRGLFLRSLLIHMGPIPAVAVQALVFAAVHFQPLQFPGLLVFGLLAGGLAVWTGRLGASWALHLAFNGVTLILLL